MKDEDPYTGLAFNYMPKGQIAHDLALLMLQNFTAEDDECPEKGLVQKYVDYCAAIVSELDKLP